MRRVLFGMLGFMACGTPTGPGDGIVELTMTAAEIEGQQYAVLTLTNQSRRNIYLSGCSLGIEKMTSEGWRLVAGHSCIPEVRVPLEPGQVRVQQHPRPTGGTFRGGVGYAFSYTGIMRRDFSAVVAW